MPRRTKGQHFLLTAAARSLSLAKVLGMTEPAAEAMFAAIRWAATKGRPVCPRCGCPACYDCRRPTGAPRWRCKACRADDGCDDPVSIPLPSKGSSGVRKPL